MLHNSLIAVIWRVLNLFLGGMFRLILVRTIGMRMAGEADYILSISNFLLIFFLFGFNLYLSKNLIDLNKEERKQLFSNTLFAALTLFLFSNLVSIPFLMYFSFSIKEIAYILLTTLSFILSELIYYYYVGIEKSNNANFYNFLMGLIHTIVYYLIFVFYSSDFSIYFISLLISYTLIQLFAISGEVRLRRPNFNILRESVSLYAPSVIYGLFPVISRLFHKHYTDESSLFVFSTSIAFLNLLNMIPLIFSSSYAPVFAHSFRSGEKEVLEYEVKRIVRISFLLVLPMLIFIFLNANSILMFLLNKTVENGSKILYFISLVGLFRIFSFPAGILLNMTGKEKIEIFNSFFKISLLIIIMPLSSYLALGAVIAYIIAEGVISLLKFIQIKKIFNFYMLDLKGLVYFSFTSLIWYLIFAKVGELEGFQLIYVGGLLVGLSMFFNLAFSPFKDYLLIKEIFSIFLPKLRK